MRTAVIIDITVAVVLLAFLISGAHRGLFRTVAGVAAVIAALVGASYAADYLTPVVEQYAQPYLEQRVQNRVESSVKTEQAATGTQTPDLLQTMGLLRLDPDASGVVEKAAKEKLKEAGTSVQTAIEESFAETILHTALFALSFFVLLFLLKLLIHALNLVLKLPGLNFLNRLGGAALGVLEGALLLFLAIWVMRRFGVSFETKNVEDTILLRFFTTNTPLSVLSFL